MLQAAMASSERIFKLLDTPVDHREPAGAGRAAAARAGRDRVRPRLVRLQRRGLRAARRLVRRSRPASAWASSGATGAGKSTLISLLMRFYDVSRGHILVDGVDMRELDLARPAPALRPGAPGRPAVLRDDRRQHPAGQRRRSATSGVRRAAEAVHADRFIERLPQGYDSPVAERGATLSVGQKQLLSFARALAFDPQILVLDEATSSVDTETELLIRDALQVLMAGRTTIAIAHRLSTIQDMDKILVLHKGELREVGHAPGTAGPARHLLPALPASVQGPGDAKQRPAGRCRPRHRGRATPGVGTKSGKPAPTFYRRRRPSTTDYRLSTTCHLL